MIAGHAIGPFEWDAHDLTIIYEKLSAGPLMGPWWCRAWALCKRTLFGVHILAMGEPYPLPSMNWWKDMGGHTEKDGKYGALKTDKS